ncbi:toprim domain-containing protein [Chitinophaga japonensis]|uniref:Toprim domain-containing protein n=1 Tax=Chitinophaga japonensis TaxID=104662 RepID=A0A562SMQ2_CHIJA|nr:toprim domain-containing protein [Chitinophaga japonensis]TWI82571.1 Toprim domain-containing protein [Chitinophaga japonensis]
MKKLTITEAKQIDITDYLASQRHYPDPKMSNSREFWYSSPLPGRVDNKPSFKVDRKLNLWFDHGIGKGGSIIDFGIQYHGCTIPEFLEKLQTFLSFHRDLSPALPGPGDAQLPHRADPTTLSGEKKKIRGVSAGPITSPALVHYLGQRRIPVELAQAYCREVQYKLHGKQYYAIGFPNDAGGYELRNPYFKGSSSPKGITFIDHGANQVAVFEGFFNFLSFLTIYQGRNLQPINLLVLNSLSFFEKSQPLMERHQTIDLYLDRDTAGIKYTAQVVKENSPYKDCSILYQGCKDLNQWLIQNFLQIQREIQAIKRATGVADDVMNKQVARDRQRGHRF